MPAETGYTAFLRELPHDWHTAQISEVAKVVGGGTPSRDVPAFWGGDIPWVTPGEVSGEGSAHLRETRERISVAGLAGSGATLLPAGSLMVTTRATLGARAINAVPMTTNQGFKSLVFESSNDAPFYYYLTDKLKPELKRRASGTTFLEVSGVELSRIEVPVPPARERQLIAEILDTLDTTIRQTEAMIEKLKQVKQGLLHDLLTRGVDANGELRPPRSQAPHFYKDSPLGWIPREWEAIGLADMARSDRSVLRTGPFGSSLKGEHLTESGRPVVTIGSLGVGRFLTDELLYVSETTAFVLADFELRPGDIAFSRVADVGRSVVVREAERGWIMSSNFMRISVDSSRVAPEFLQAALAHDLRVKKQLRARVNSAGRDVASSAILMSLIFPVPLYNEQMQINVRMTAVDQRIEAEARLLMKMQAERVGLMDDLLTGRVRVTPLLA